MQSDLEGKSKCVPSGRIPKRSSELLFSQVTEALLALREMDQMAIKASQRWQEFLVCPDTLDFLVLVSGSQPSVPYKLL